MIFVSSMSTANTLNALAGKCGGRYDASSSLFDIENSRVSEKTQNRELWCFPNAMLDDDGKCLFWGEEIRDWFAVTNPACDSEAGKASISFSNSEGTNGSVRFSGSTLGTMFFQFDQSQSSAQNRFGALFISISAIVMGSVATIPELYSQRRVFYQQKNAGTSLRFHGKSLLSLQKFP